MASSFIETHKESIILGFSVIAYVMIVGLIMARTITGTNATSGGLYNTVLYLSLLLGPVVGYYYIYGLPSIQLDGTVNKLKTVGYFVAFVGLVYAAIYLIGNFSIVLGSLSFLIGGLILVVFMAFVYEGTAGAIKRMDPNNESATMNWVKFLWEFVFYIPCLLIDIINYISRELELTPSPIWTLFTAEIALLLLYYYLPDIVRLVTIHDGTLLVNRPTNLNKKQILGSVIDIFPKSTVTAVAAGGATAGTENPFIQKESISAGDMAASGVATDMYGNVKDISCSAIYLKGRDGYVDVSGCDLDKYDPTYTTYQEEDTSLAAGGSGRTGKYIRNYCVALWVFINPQPSTVGLYSLPTNIFRIGKEKYENTSDRARGKPALSYFNKTDVADSIYEPTYRMFLSNRDTQFTDLKLPDQKWNLFVFNYTDNSATVYANGEMVAARKFEGGAPEFLETDYLVLGEDGGLDGSVTSLVFFPHILTPQQIRNYYSTTGGRGAPPST